jgi:hypothetical protein
VFFFSKYINKWFVPKEDKYLWKKEIEKKSYVQVFARLMLTRGSSYIEAKLKAQERWSMGIAPGILYHTF